MLVAIFRRCFNPFGGLSPPVKTGVRVSHPRLVGWPYSIVKQAFRTIGTVPPPPPPPLERSKK